MCHLKRFQMFPSLSFFKGGHNLILFDFFEFHDLRFSFHGANVELRARTALVRCLAGLACARACVCVRYIYSFFIFCLSHYPVFLFSDSTRTRAHTHTSTAHTHTLAHTYTHKCQCRTKCRPLQGEDSPLMSLSVRLPTVRLGAEITSVGEDYYRL